MITKEQIKNTGATFTPKELAVFLAERIALYAQSKNNRVLDPACGEGELLVAMGEVLKEKGISQTWLAQKLNKSYNTVNEYARNVRQPSIHDLYKIAKILNVDAKDLLK